MLISLLITLIVIGALLYIIGLLPIDGIIKQIIYVVAIVAVFVWLLKTFGHLVL